MDADFGKFIKNVMNHHESIIVKPIVSDTLKKQY